MRRPTNFQPKITRVSPNIYFRVYPFNDDSDDKFKFKDSDDGAEPPYSYLPLWSIHGRVGEKTEGAQEVALGPNWGH